MLKKCQKDELSRLNLKANPTRLARKNRKLKRLALKAAKRGKKARMDGDFTDKLCEMVKAERSRFEQYLSRKNIPMESRSAWAREFEYESDCVCEREVDYAFKSELLLSLEMGRATVLRKSIDNRWTRQLCIS